MKLSLPAVYLSFSTLLVEDVAAACVFRNMVDAEDSELMNPHKKTNENLKKNLKNNIVSKGTDKSNNQKSEVRQLQDVFGPQDFPEFAAMPYDGSHTLGAAFADLIRIGPVDYADSSGAMKSGPNPRLVSNTILTDTGFGGLASGVTDMFWQWGQFLDHDIDLTEPAASGVDASIACPGNEDPLCTLGDTMSFRRSGFYMDEEGVPQQTNFITALVDGSAVYGSDEERAHALREFVGGRMLMSNDGLLPRNDFSPPLENANAPGLAEDELFVAGDVRANEQLGLLSMHTLFVREHNRIAADVAADYPEATDEQIYQFVRKLVGFEMQIITYKEFLPLLLGRKLSPDPKLYSFDKNIDPRIANEFSTVAYRFGHSMISPDIRFYDGVHDEIVPLEELFFNPSLMSDATMDRIMGGLISKQAQKVDNMINDEIRDNLFRQGFLDLGSLNIQRGRDHGLPRYNAMRQAYGLSTYNTFEEMSRSPQVASLLAKVYNSPDEVDAWVGGLCEPILPGAMVGELFATAIAEQFTRLRDGDPLFYYGDLELRKAPYNKYLKWSNFQLADLIRSNTNIDVTPNARVMEF